MGLSFVPGLAQEKASDQQTIHAKAGEIPILVIAPKETKARLLVIWLTGFSGLKESVEVPLRELAKHGFVALSFDPYQHGERRIEAKEELVKRVRGNIRRYFWPILARTAEETPKVTDWAIKNPRGARRGRGARPFADFTLIGTVLMKIQIPIWRIPALVLVGHLLTGTAGVQSTFLELRETATPYNYGSVRGVPISSAANVPPTRTAARPQRPYHVDRIPELA